MQFKDLNSLQKFLERNSPFIMRNGEIKNALAKIMQKAVHDVVYAHYAPTAYMRLGDKGGLSDPRNMHITKVEVNNGLVRILFENLRASQTHYDIFYEGEFKEEKLHGNFIVDTIEDGIDANWYDPDGPWSDARPFVKETIKRIHADPSHLINAIKSAYRKAGFIVK